MGREDDELLCIRDEGIQEVALTLLRLGDFEPGGCAAALLPALWRSSAERGFFDGGNGPAVFARPLLRILRKYRKGFLLRKSLITFCVRQKAVSRIDAEGLIDVVQFLRFRSRDEPLFNRVRTQILRVLSPQSSYRCVL